MAPARTTTLAVANQAVAEGQVAAVAEDLVAVADPVTAVAEGQVAVAGQVAAVVEGPVAVADPAAVADPVVIVGDADHDARKKTRAWLNAW